MNLTLPAFGQKTAMGRNLLVSGRGFFALSPPMGYKNLMCEAQRLRRRSSSLVFRPPPVSDRAMRADKMRTQAYRHAIERHAPGKLCLDVGTGALALLAIITARAGAEHVFAVEANAEAAAAARQTVAAEGLEAQITIIEGYSTDVTLQRGVDLLLHEIIGEIAPAEGVVSSALARHHIPQSS